MVETESPDIVILDLGLPDISGYEALQQIRLFSEVPILILTVRSEESDIVKGLEWGADDYMVKPFKQLELLARVKALIRRQAGSSNDQPLTVGTIQFDPNVFQVRKDNKEISLTRTEGSIFYHLLRNAGNVVNYSSLAETVWGDDYPGSADSLKVYIRRLREKLEIDPSNPTLILTRPGIGYLFVKPQ